MHYATEAPYEVRETSAMSAHDLIRIRRFARYWDLYGNSGRFTRTLPALLNEHPFARFMAFSDWLHARTAATHRLALETQMELLHDWLVEVDDQSADPISLLLQQDYAASGAHGRPRFMAKGATLGRASHRASHWRSDQALS
jgi:hypothetical protein